MKRNLYIGEIVKQDGRLYEVWQMVYQGGQESAILNELSDEEAKLVPEEDIVDLDKE